MTYADDFDLRDKDLCTINGIANAVDGLLCPSTVAGSAGSQTLSTMTATAMTGMSQSVVVPDGGSVLISVQGLLQIDTVDDQIEIAIRRDASPQILLYYVARVTFDRHTISGLFIDKPSAGTYTYSAYIRNLTGARNYTTSNRAFITLKLQGS